MRDDKFTTIEQNMREYEWSVRDAVPDNDDFRMAFEATLAEDNLPNDQDILLAFDFFKAGWEAAVRVLADPPEVPQAEAGSGAD